MESFPTLICPYAIAQTPRISHKRIANPLGLYCRQQEQAEPTCSICCYWNNLRSLHEADSFSLGLKKEEEIRYAATETLRQKN